MISVDFQGTSLHIGDTVRVKSTIVEGGKSRVQSFEGLIISLSGRGEERMVTVRRIGNRGIGVERIWPLNARVLVGIDVVKRARRVRRAKLYYLRELTGRMATRV